MPFQMQKDDGVWIVAPVGQLGAEAEETDELVRRVTDLLAEPRQRIIVDLANVSFMNSSGIGALVRIVAQANLQEGRVVLAQPNAAIKGLLQMTRLDTFIPVAATLGAARERLLQPASEAAPAKPAGGQTPA